MDNNGEIWLAEICAYDKSGNLEARARFPRPLPLVPGDEVHINFVIKFNYNKKELVINMAPAPAS